MENKLNYIVLESLLKSSKLLKDELNSIFRDFDLGMTEFGLLEAIHTLGAQPIQVLANRILITSGSMTYTVNQLIKKGLISREVFSGDNRVFFLDLTENGKETINKTLEKHDAFLEKFFSNLEKEERMLLTKLLRKLY